MEYGSGLQTVLAYGIAALFVIVLSFFALMVVLRAVHSRKEHRLETKKMAIRPVLQKLVGSDMTFEDAAETLKDVIRPKDLGVLELVMLETAPGLAIDRRAMITGIAETLGLVDDDIETLARPARASRKAQSAFHLGVLATPGAVGPLLDALHSSADEDVIFACLNSLSRIGTPEAILGIADYLAAHDEEIENVRVAEVLLERPREFSPYVLKWLREGLDDPLRLDFLLKVAGAMEEPALFDVVAAYTGYEDEQIRATATRSMGLLRDRRACGLLTRAMGDVAVQVRSEAAEAIGRVGCTESLDALRAGLGDTDNRVRRTSAFALTRLGEEGRMVLKEAVSAADREERDAATEVFQVEEVRRKGGKE